MKKDLLIVIPSLSAGGGEKSLVNLLSQINFKLYNVDLFLFSKSGLFVNSIPEQVNIIEPSEDYTVFTSPFFKSIKHLWRKKNIKLLLSRCLFTLNNRVIRNSAIAEQKNWKYYRTALDTLTNKYDVAIGYLEKSSVYFVVDHVKAKKKIGWIHTNYTSSGLNSLYDYPFFEQLDYIVTVSDECERSLKEHFPNLKNKVRVVQNIVSPKNVKQLSLTKLELITSSKYVNIVTVARLSKEKGIDLAINACEKLKTKGYKIKWFVIGEGVERKKLQSLIESKNLQENFILLGLKENPYPYVYHADIYVQPSRIEGKAIAVEEAKILNKPIIITNFDSAKDQIENEVSGLIVEKDENAISRGIERIINNPSLKYRLIKNLEIGMVGTEEEINKFYALL